MLPTCELQLTWALKSWSKGFRMPSSVETAISVKSPRRNGQFASFLPEAPIRPCPWDVVEQHTCDDMLRRQAAGSATLGFLRRGSASPSFLPVDRAAQLRPAMLDGCRMPSSHQGMPNFIGIVGVPDLDGRRRPVWFESFNELTHLLDLIIESEVAAIATQPLQLQWTFGRHGARRHYPDFLIETKEGCRLLIDVTRATKLATRADTRAICHLTGETARLLGWEYQVRTELPAQRARNLRFLWPDHEALSSSEIHDLQARVPAGRWTMRLDELERELGPGGRGLILRLLGLGLLHTDLDRPIAEWSTISTQPIRQEREPWLYQL